MNSTSDSSQRTSVPVRPARLRQLLMLASVVNAGLIVWLAVRLVGAMPATTEDSRPLTRRLQPAGAAKSPVSLLSVQRDNHAWHRLPVEEGRIKPFESWAIESVRQITGRARFRGLDPTDVVLDWALGTTAAAPNGWDSTPFILCDHRDLRRAIFAPDAGDSVGGKYIAPDELRRSAGFDELLRVVAEARTRLEGKAHRELTNVQLKAEQVSRRLALYDQICGRRVTPLVRSALLDGRFVDFVPSLSMGATREEVLRSLNARPAPDRGPPTFLDFPVEIRRAYQTSDDDYLELVQRFVAERAAELGSGAIGIELSLNRWRPFLWAWVSMALAAVAWSCALISGTRPVVFAAYVLYSLSLFVQAAGFVMRLMVSGRAPVANIYETVIFVALMTAIFALVLELIYRRHVIALTGALVATLGLILADQLPLALDPSISPMVPVLRTNFWLTVHVLTIVASYAGGTLAWGLGNVTLGMMAFGKPADATVKMLVRFTYRGMQIAVILLAAGTLLGGWWAAEAWGRFWGWDPKEVGAVVALVCYVIPLHARYIGWVRDFGLAVSAVVCYASILLSWYVINFLLAAGLHTYGFSGGGGEWVLLACLVNAEWVLIASHRYQSQTENHRGPT